MRWFKKECIYSGGIITENMSDYCKGGSDLYKKISDKIEEIKLKTPSSS